MVTRIRLSICGTEAASGPGCGPQAAPMSSARQAPLNPILVPNSRFLMLDTPKIPKESPSGKIPGPETGVNIERVRKLIHKGWPRADPGTILKSDG